MMTKYEIEVNNEIICSNLVRLQSQIFKLLPMREEEQEWEKPLETIILELLGLYGLCPELEKVFALICKLQGLLEYKEEENFMLYRRTIFECCGLIDRIKLSL